MLAWIDISAGRELFTGQYMTYFAGISAVFLSLIAIGAGMAVLNKKNLRINLKQLDDMEKNTVTAEATRDTEPTS